MVFVLIYLLLLNILIVISHYSLYFIVIVYVYNRLFNIYLIYFFQRVYYKSTDNSGVCNFKFILFGYPLPIFLLIIYIGYPSRYTEYGSIPFLNECT